MILLVTLFASHYGDSHSVAGALLIVGVLIAVWAGLRDATKSSRGGSASAAVTQAQSASDLQAREPSVEQRPLVAPATDVSGRHTT